MENVKEQFTSWLGKQKNSRDGYYSKSAIDIIARTYENCLNSMKIFDVPYSDLFKYTNLEDFMPIYNKIIDNPLYCKKIKDGGDFHTEHSNYIKHYKKFLEEKKSLNTLSVQEYFIKKVDEAGYERKSYNQLSEKSVQKDGKIKLYYIPLKDKNLKLCLHGVDIPLAENLKGVEVIPYQNTYPNKYTQRIYFRECELSEVKEFLDNILEQLGIISSNDILKDLIIKYAEYKSSQEYNEQYKYEYAYKNKGIFDNLFNLKDNFNNLEKPNFMSYFLGRCSGLRHLIDYHFEDLKTALEILFSDNDLSYRIRTFQDILNERLRNDTTWHNKNTLLEVQSVSYFLFTNNYEKYLLFTHVKPYNIFAKIINLPYLLNYNSQEERYINWQEYCKNTLCKKMDEVLNKKHTLLDAQDFIWFVGKGNTKEDTEEIKNEGEDMTTDIPDQTLNQILYGPPGTGKTYNTVLKAMSVVHNKKYENVSIEKYSELKTEFDKLKENRQIEFVTFHQSYSYEEFVEGIKPDLDSDSLSYKLEDGIFKQICKEASRNLYKDVCKEQSQIVSFDMVLNIFKESYPNGSNFKNLYNIFYEDNELVYHYGAQEQGRKISLLKIKELFSANKQYKNSIDFNKEYKGNIGLRNYHFAFYKELINIKNNIEDGNQIPLEKRKEYTVNSNTPKYILIIDEINRGNVSKIFGELITLIEEDKRDNLEVSLPYSKEAFSVPKNLYIIGTMNTSDRSIASIDIALRRRFKFIEMMPKAELVADFGCGFREIFKELNKKIKILLDRDHQIGHSYFINTKYENAGIETLKDIWFSEILPLLNEYFYCDWEKLKLIIPGFIEEIKDIPENLKNECDETIYEFKTIEDFSDEAFENALKQ